MSWYLWVILGYLLVLTGVNFYRSRQIKTQEDFMVAGRKLSLTTMVFTLVCTWIGSGTFIAGAEYAYYAGWSAIWQPPAGDRDIPSPPDPHLRQYTAATSEVRAEIRAFSGPPPHIAFTTIVSYQFRSGYIQHRE
jgi:SSS family solute:Na+ symporter/sodium/proline symporter